VAGHQRGAPAWRKVDARRIATDGVLEAIDGTPLAVEADSLLLHGDNPGAVATARAIRAGLEAAGVGVRAMAAARGSRV